MLLLTEREVKATLSAIEDRLDAITAKGSWDADLDEYVVLEAAATEIAKEFHVCRETTKRERAEALANGLMRCAECGQPDNCGDCDHTPLTAEEVRQLG